MKFSVFLLICAVFTQDICNSERSPREEGRELGDYNQDWRAVDYLPPTSETSGWIPHAQSAETQEQTPKRRRIRKRKRRPPVFTPTDDEIPEHLIPSRKQLRPQRLDQIKEPWEEMGEEVDQKSNNRRRLTPVYDETEPKTHMFEKIRDPFTALQEAEEKQKKKTEEGTTKTPDLKTLLKQSGGLSLSEVLQQKNLTLSELLKGNRQAISALAREAETTTETVSSTESAKYRRLPPSIGLKKDISRNYERGDSIERLTAHEVMEAQRKRLALLHSHKDSKLFPDVTKVDVVTEETTEKRIFVPSNLDSEPSSELREVTTTPPVTTELIKIIPNPFKPKTRNLLPITSAKLKVVSQPYQENVSKTPPSAVTITVNEIFGFNILDNKNETETPDGPLKMSIDLEEMVTTERSRDNENVEAKTQSPTLDELAVSTTMSVREKFKHVTAKEEIMEILKNPIEREHLSRILQTRNMTVEELVEQRERGSSQLHLADIFHNKTREPEPKDEPFIGHVHSEGFNDFPFFSRKSKTIPMIPKVTTAPSTQPSVKEQEVATTKLPYTITSFPTYKIETNKEASVQPIPPIWKQLYPSLFSDIYDNNHYQDHTEVIRPTTTTEKINYDDLERLEEIENALAEAANSRLNVDLPQNVYDDEEFISIPSGVKSAILASLAIIGLSLLVFLTILVIFKWSQKQKRRLNYNGSFSGSKIRSPILESDRRRTFKAFMTETLGRKKNYYKTHLQSMSDSIWDSEEKKSYMI